MPTIRRTTAMNVFVREYWSQGRQSMPVSIRILHLKRDLLLGVTKVVKGDVVGAVFMPQEVDVLRLIAAGDVIVGVDLPQHIAEAQLKWIANGGHYDEDGA